MQLLAFAGANGGMIQVVTGVLSAFGSIASASAQAEQQRLQGQQAQLEGQRKALQYEQRANQTLERIGAANASARARAFAGGVQGFSGSALVIQDANMRKGGKEFSIDMNNSAAAIRSGNLQNELYQQAADSTEMSGYFDAVGKLGTAAYSYSKLGGAPVTPAPIEERSIFATS
jgi:TolA-binding protein